MRIAVLSFLLFIARITIAQNIVTSMTPYSEAIFDEIAEEYWLMDGDTVLSFWEDEKGNRYFHSMMHQYNRKVIPSLWRVTKEDYTMADNQVTEVLYKNAMMMKDMRTRDRIDCYDYDGGNPTATYTERWDYSSNVVNGENNDWKTITNYYKEDNKLEEWRRSQYLGHEGREKMESRNGDTLNYEWTALDGRINIRDNWEAGTCVYIDNHKEGSFFSSSHGAKDGSVQINHGDTSYLFRWYEDQRTYEETKTNRLTRSKQWNTRGVLIEENEVHKTINGAGQYVEYFMKKHNYFSDSTVVEEWWKDSISGSLILHEKRVLRGELLFRKELKKGIFGNEYWVEYKREDGKLVKQRSKTVEFQVDSFEPCPMWVPYNHSEGRQLSNNFPLSARMMRVEFNLGERTGVEGEFNLKYIYFQKGDSIYSFERLKGEFLREFDTKHVRGEATRVELKLSFETDSRSIVSFDSTGNEDIDSLLTNFMDTWIDGAQVIYGGNLHYYERTLEGLEKELFVPDQYLAFEIDILIDATKVVNGYSY